MRLTYLLLLACLVISSALVFMMVSDAANGDDAYKYRRKAMTELDPMNLYSSIKSVDPTQNVPRPIRGYNGHDTVWAVFFHRPYCGACRRIKPTFKALGFAVNSTKLRFAMMDCHAYKSFCAKEGADRQPRIALYKAKEGTNTIEREPIAMWSGMLIGYELVYWFKDQQTMKNIPSDVKWPGDDELALATTYFKGRPDSTIDPLITLRAQENRTGYLKDIRSALYQGLVDDIFRGKDILKGRRLRALIKWLKAVEITYPLKSVRMQIGRFMDILLSPQQFEWSEVDYNKALKEAGILPVSDDDWEWCVPAGAGVGGYPCGLWTLFHTMLANSNSLTAKRQLRAIQTWVEHFYGCEHCVEHFKTMWKKNNGDGVDGHIESAIWLWKAHNEVRERLSSDDTTTLKEQWPSRSHCEGCINETDTNGRLPKDGETIWMEGFVFEFMQEIYCAGSDTLPCAQFWNADSEGASWFMTSSLVGLGLAAVALFVCIAVVCLEDDDEEENMFDDTRARRKEPNLKKQKEE